MARKKANTAPSAPLSPPNTPSALPGAPNITSSALEPELHERPLSTADHLALAVLRGDRDAADILVDYITEIRASGVRRIEVNSRRLEVDHDRIRAIMFVAPGVKMTSQDLFRIRTRYQEWLLFNEPLVLQGVERIEFYSLPEDVPGQVMMQEYLGTGTGAPGTEAPPAHANEVSTYNE